MASLPDQKDLKDIFKQPVELLEGIKGERIKKLNTLKVSFVVDGLKDNGQVKEELASSEKPLRDLLILDVQCGRGSLTEELAKLGPEKITGIDPSDDSITEAKERASQNESLSNLTYSLDSVEDHAKENKEKYDAVIASEALEHVPDAEAFIKSCLECLKPGGSVFIISTNKTVLSWFLGVFLLEMVLNRVPRGTRDWKKCVPPADVKDILKKNDCTTSAVRGMTLNPLTASMVWTNSTAFMYAIHAVKKNTTK